MNIVEQSCWRISRAMSLGNNVEFGGSYPFGIDIHSWSSDCV